jgi:hypothetical protein
VLQQKRIIAYELNEVPTRVLDFFAAHRPKSAIARLIRKSAYYATYDTDVGQLVPWSSWATQHRGVNNEHHCISDLGQDLSDVDKDYPPIWSILSRNGVRTGVFGALNSYPVPEDLTNYSFYVPDTFAAGSECFPADLGVFQEFNLRMVDLSSRNVNASIVLKPAFDLMRKAPFLGVRGTTFYRLAKQLVHEKIDARRVGRRRTSQVELAFDLYLKQLKKTKPDYACFFTNHVASSLHRYWPGLFPGDYKHKKLSEEWLQIYCGEIMYTMGAASQQIGDLEAFVEQHLDLDYVLMVSTSMGQAAVDNNEVIRKQLYLGDRERFMEWLGLSREQWSPRRAMLPRYIFTVNDHVKAQFRNRLDNISINGEKISYHAHEGNVFQIKLGQANLSDDEIVIQDGSDQIDYRAMGMVNTTIDDETGSYAYHIPDGLMFIYDPKAPEAHRSETKMSTTEVAPMILRNFGVDVPTYMGA